MVKSDLSEGGIFAVDKIIRLLLSPEVLIANPRTAAGGRISSLSYVLPLINLPKKLLT